MAAALKRLIDTSFKFQIFEYIMTEEYVKVVHLPFQIPSQWCRGLKETLLLAVVLEKDISSDLFHPLLREIVGKITLLPDVYKALYKIKQWRDPAVHEMAEMLEVLLKESFNLVQNTLEQSAIGLLLFLGLNKVGKTSILEWLRVQTFTPEIKPTLAASVIELLLEKYRIKAIDVSGQKSLRKTWWTYPKSPDAIVFVVDLTESPERLDETRDEFEKIMVRFTRMFPKL